MEPFHFAILIAANIAALRRAPWYLTDIASQMSRHIWLLRDVEGLQGAAKVNANTRDQTGQSRDHVTWDPIRSTPVTRKRCTKLRVGLEARHIRSMEMTRVERSAKDPGALT